MIKEELDDKPEEVSGRAGLHKKSQYLKDME
jgi:hypothetical protein